MSQAPQGPTTASRIMAVEGFLRAASCGWFMTPRENRVTMT